MNRQLAVLSLILISTGLWAQRAQDHYDLHTPDRKHQLPTELNEVSALTDVTNTTVAALQDEVGTIFFLDHRTGAILTRSEQIGAGDFEGLTRVGSDLYALRSDGMVYHLATRHGELALADSFRVNVPNRDLESIGYDEEEQLLLIAAKDNLKGSPADRDRRFIYGWDLRKGALLERPVLDMSLQQVIAEATALGIRLPKERKKNGREHTLFKLRPSSIAVQPQDRTYWILSAADHALLVVDRKGRLVDLVQLPPKLYPKAEGITFMANGDLLISNEGHDRPATLLFFTRK